jgi:hypothetical protein
MISTGVFQRLRDMTKASMHELLDKVEDPIVMLNQYLRDAEEEIAKAEVQVAKQIAGERKLKERLDEAGRLSAQCELKAADALKSGQEAAARQYLEEKLYHDQKAAGEARIYRNSGFPHCSFCWNKEPWVLRNMKILSVIGEIHLDFTLAIFYLSLARRIALKQRYMLSSMAL